MLNPLVTVPEQTEFQYYLAVFVLVALAVVIVYIVYSSRYYRLPEENKKIKSSVLTQLYKQNPNSVRIPANQDPDDYRLPVHNSFGGNEPERETIRAGTKKLMDEARDFWSPIYYRVPEPLRRTGTVAFFVVLFGAIAVSTSAVVALLTRDRDAPSFGYLIDRVSFYTMELYTTLKDVVFSFPYAGTLWNLAYAYTILLIEWLYNNWPVVAVALIATGIALYMFDRSKLDEPGRVMDSSFIGVKALLMTVGVWFAGVIPTIFIRQMGFQNLAPVIGLVIAFLVTILIVYHQVTSWYQSFDQFPRGQYGYLATRTTATSLIWTGWFLVSLYIVSSIVNQSLFVVWNALMKAPIENKLIVAIIAFSPVVATLYEVRESWGDLKAGWQETSTRTRVKTKALGKGVPVLLVVFGYILAYSFTESILLSVMISISVGIASRLVYAGLMKVRVGKSPIETDDTIPTDVLVQTYVLDVDGETQYYVIVDGDHKYAWDDKTRLVDDVMERVREIGKDGRADPSMCGHHAEYLVEYGIADTDETRMKVHEKARKFLVNELRTGDGTIGRDELRRELDDLPVDVVRDRIDEYRARGIMSTDQDQLILEWDPWT